MSCENNNYDCNKRYNELCRIAKKITDSIVCQQQKICCILDLEYEKIKRTLYSCSDVDELVDVNNSAASMIESLAELENVLYKKLDLVLPILAECYNDERC